MERRKFINAAVATSACALASMVIPDRAHSQGENKRYPCKITVLKRIVFNDLYEKYRKGEGSVCPQFKEEQEFIAKTPWEPPKDFCVWAWADIRSYIHGVCYGNSNKVIVCCTDGFRPVIFKLERIDE